MSASNWAICPQCYKNALQGVQDLRDDLAGFTNVTPQAYAWKSQRNINKREERN